MYKLTLGGAFHWSCLSLSFPRALKNKGLVRDQGQKKREWRATRNKIWIHRGYERDIVVRGVTWRNVVANKSV